MYDKEFGEIFIHRRANMRRATARIKYNGLHITVPEYASEISIAMFIDNHREQIRLWMQRNVIPSGKYLYHLEQRIPCLKGEILITTYNMRPNTTAYKRDEQGHLFVFISTEDDITTDTKQHAISAALKNLAKETAPHVLIPFAWEVVKEMNLTPTDIVIGRGIRKLGHCTAKGVIQLSYMLMLMPEHLVRYIIYHELAHLTEMNHSPQFHAICNAYCNGQEKLLEKQLKAFKFPLLES